MKRILVAALALFTGLNGLAMLLAGRAWYGAVPGVTETGPFNPHFVKDIGAAYLAAGVGLAWLAIARSPRGLGAAFAGALFLALHAGIHLVEAVGAPTGLSDLARDAPGVILPAILALWVAWPARPALETSHA
jgi:hypothetical protein